MLDPDIQTLVGMGDIIGAIGLYQQRHGGSTLVARRAIDAARHELAEAAAAGAATPATPVRYSAPMTLVNDLELDAALRAGEKITAIKRYREVHGVGLKQAKDAVEAIQAGRVVDHPAHIVEDPAPQLQPELDRLIHAGQKIGAIKHYRTVTNLGLKESKDLVEARMAELQAGAVATIPLSLLGHALPGLQPELDRLIRANHKILAIKHYRDLAPHIGLKEAKDAVEARMAELTAGG